MGRTKISNFYNNGWGSVAEKVKKSLKKLNFFEKSVDMDRINMLTYTR